MIRSALWSMIISLGFSAIAGDSSQAQALDGTITYQGQLKQSGSPLNAVADLEFTLFDALAGGTQVGSTVSVNGVNVADGVFTVPLNFGTASFNGNQRWVEIAVRSPAGSGSFTTLTPRQPLTAAPYALYALSGPGGSGPWAVNGIHIHNTNTGNVGIGTTTPTHLLDLCGLAPAVDLQDTASSANQTGYISFRNNGNTLTGWMGFGVVGSPDLSIVNARSGGDIILDPFNGGVGIGTDAPAVLLHARGTGPVMVLQDEASTANQAGYVGFWNSAGTETGWMGYGTPGSPHMTILNARSNGDITLDPGPAGGEVIARGNLRVGGNGEFQVASGVESLRIIRGVVNANATISAGTGFSVADLGAGGYRITFSPAFFTIPAISGMLRSENTASIIKFLNLTNSSVDIQVFSSSTVLDCGFSFIAIGPS